VDRGVVGDRKEGLLQPEWAEQSALKLLPQRAPTGLGSGAGELVDTKIVDEANDVYVPPSR
jgi:hypothetical protein